MKTTCTFWEDSDKAKEYLATIAVNDYVPGYTQMQRLYGKPFTRNIKKHGGYKKLVSETNMKICNCYRSSDGHILSSWYEYLFDEYLYLNGINHEVDGFICDESRCRYDFKIDDVYVEIWGITNIASAHFNSYSSRRKKKEDIYASNNLKLISIEGVDFSKSSQDLQALFCDKLSKFCIKSSKQDSYPVVNYRRLGYWCNDTIIKELKEVIGKIGDFPTGRQLFAMNMFNLGTAIVKFGGYRKFAQLLGHQPKTKAFSEVSVMSELLSLTQQLGHFPCDRELQEVDRSDLASMIKTHGGYGCFKEKVTGQKDKKPFGYWNDESNLIAEFKNLQDKLGHFPTYNELGLLAKGVDKSKKGMLYFRRKLEEQYGQDQ